MLEVIAESQENTEIMTRFFVEIAAKTGHVGVSMNLLLFKEQG